MADVPGIPDYASLAEKTQQSNQTAMAGQTLANRPNQTNQQGSLTWTQDPTTGQWTQTQSLNPTLAAAANSQQQTQAGLSAGANGMVGQAVDSLGKPLDMSGLSQVQAYDPSKFNAIPASGFGAVQEVQDAMMGRLNPALENSRNSLIQRLRSQGVSQGSDAYDRAIHGADLKENDANQQALLAATGAYGDIFNRGLAGRQQQSSEGMNSFNTSTSDRARQLAELTTQRNQPMTDLKGLLGAAGSVQAPTFAGFNTSGNAGGVDYYGAGKDTYGDQLDNYNAESARTAANRSGNIALGKGLLDEYGGDITKWLAGLFGGEG